MADKEAAAPAADAPKKGGKKKLIIIGAVTLVLLLGGGGAGAYVYMSKKQAEAEAAAAAEAEEEEAPNKKAKKKKKEPKKTPVFVDLETFTVNLKDKDDERFMQVKLVAEVADAPAGELLKTFMPSLRNEILLLLSSKQASELTTREAKEALQVEIVAAANKILEGTTAEDAVQTVNFTHLIIQ